jgi:hypothetical protein
MKGAAQSLDMCGAFTCCKTGCHRSLPLVTLRQELLPDEERRPVTRRAQRLPVLQDGLPQFSITGALRQELLPDEERRPVTRRAQRLPVLQDVLTQLSITGALRQELLPDEERRPVTRRDQRLHVLHDWLTQFSTNGDSALRAAAR